MVNELVSMQFAAEMYDSLSPTLYRKGAVDPRKIPNKPGAWAPVENMDESQSLSNAAMRLQPGNHTSNAAALREQIAASMQARYGSFSGAGGGAPDVKAATTATGISLLSEHALGRMAPSLALQAELDAERCYQILEMRQRHWPEEMYATLDRKVGGDAGRWFREADIRRDFRVEVVPQSWWPQTEAGRRVDFSEYAKIALTLAPQDPQIAKSLLQRAGELFGRGIEVEFLQSHRVDARVRLEKIRAAARYLETEAGVPVYGPEGEPVPELVAVALRESDAPLDVIFDRHDAYVEALSDWLLTSEGRDESKFVRACIRGRALEHFEAKKEQAVFFKGLAIQAQIPDKMAEAASNEIDARQQMQLQEEAKDLQDERELSQMAFAAQVAEEAGRGEAALMPTQ
jgi:hypothetical protein